MLSTLPSVAGPPPEAAVLLVLLPLAPSGAGQVATCAALHTLQQQLGAAIRVLCVDEAAHPDVVRSFDGQGLPAWVLMRHGVELWRQPGMPSSAATVALIMSKLALLPVASN
ncbi:ammonia monooxygenase [Hymenobacter nivis]|uniref:Ammonia monooxygenase n=1 Tax=Hymenobacter nivis TaxID=1850093 RepID=A0A2Z3GT57_9BACT|nr:ammonia monooxygenase [Hymenobacter nivis]AWM31860.1 ammonia monooxygenase [Hymenobacter nivis]